MNLALTIDAELQSLIAPLMPQEFDLLKAQILEQGCLQPLCVWKTEDKRWFSPFILILFCEPLPPCRHGLKASIKKAAACNHPREFPLLNT